MQRANLNLIVVLPVASLDFSQNGTQSCNLAREHYNGKRNARVKSLAAFEVVPSFRRKLLLPEGGKEGKKKKRTKAERIGTARATNNSYKLAGEAACSRGEQRQIFFHARAAR